MAAYGTIRKNLAKKTSETDPDLTALDGLIAELKLAADKEPVVREVVKVQTVTREVVQDQTLIEKIGNLESELERAAGVNQRLTVEMQKRVDAIQVRAESLCIKTVLFFRALRDLASSLVIVRAAELGLPIDADVQKTKKFILECLTAHTISMMCNEGCSKDEINSKISDLKLPGAIDETLAKAFQEMGVIELAATHCCLCGKEFDSPEELNNPYPLADDGMCCGRCDETVIAARGTLGKYGYAYCNRDAPPNVLAKLRHQYLTDPSAN